jgi:hypothetical protein
VETFNEVGFLSKALGTWVAETRSQFHLEFATADRINRLAMKMLFDLPAENMTDAHLISNCCFGRILQSFQSAVLLVERGALLDARTITRSCAESVILLSALKAEPATPNRLEEADDLHRLKFAEAILRRNDVINVHSGEEVAILKQVISEIRTKYKDKKPRDTNLWDMAELGGMQELYNLAYRSTSGDAAHPTLRALQRYFFDHSTDGCLGGFKYHPDRSDTRSTLHLACFAMVQAIGLVIDWFEMSDYATEARECITDWDRMPNS